MTTADLVDVLVRVLIAVAVEVLVTVADTVDVCVTIAVLVDVEVTTTWAAWAMKPKQKRSVRTNEKRIFSFP